MCRHSREESRQGNSPVHSSFHPHEMCCLLSPFKRCEGQTQERLKSHERVTALARDSPDRLQVHAKYKTLS